jgi:3-hydroxyisobutyrate dehydrogenase-like beta-hydroxyacid dehydrogenase
MPSSSSKTTRAPVGVVGLGLMGAAICERLLADGYPVFVYNRSRGKAEPLIAAGALWSENPFEECGRVVVSLYDADVVEQVLGQLAPGFRSGQVVIDTTTGDPQRINDLGLWLAERGVDYLEAPISGSSEQTRRHLSTALVAGPPEVFQACRDLLDSMAAKTFYLGQWGNAVRMKLATNLVLGLNRAMLAEGLVFAKAAGLSMECALDVLMNSPSYSRTMDAKGPKMVAGDFRPQAKLSQHIKDVELMIEEAARAGQRLPFSELHRELLQRAQEAGLGELDNSAIIRVLDGGLLNGAAGSHASKPAASSDAAANSK